MKERNWCESKNGYMSVIEGVIEKIANAEKIKSSILVCGPTGSGKEIIARKIHETSSPGTPFVAVNCGVLNEDLFASALFGHSKGSFTSATHDQTGYFYKAGLGTLFLDEISETSLNSQTKLLRCMQEREFSQVGSTKSCPIKFRFVCTTNKNLPELVKKGKFREDLFHRINVLRINSPCLIDRKEDLDSLTDFFLKKKSEEAGFETKKISSEARRIINNYRWPGNIRELENTIERAVILCENDIISVRDLSLSSQSLDDRSPDSDFFSLSVGENLEVAVNMFKKEFVSATLREVGDMSRTAKKLNVQRTYLYRLCKNLGINHNNILDKMTNFLPT